jgi:hypothetical protein
MALKRWIVFILAFGVAAAVGFFLFRGVGGGVLMDAPEVDWRQLGELDYLTGKAPAELSALAFFCFEVLVAACVLLDG